jgi:hypothetical protein
MANWKRAGRALCAAAAVAAVVGLSATPAIAATSLTVKVSNGGKITATTTKTVLTDAGVSVTCTSTKKTPASEASGSINNGTHSGAAPVSVGSSPKLSFNNCSGPLGKVTTKVLSLKGGYTIAVDSTTNKKGETDGIIGPVSVHVKMTGCSFNVTGSAPGYFNNTNHTLVVTSKLPNKALVKAQLTISGVDGCFTLVKNGQHPGYSASYTLGKSKVTVSSST